VIEDTQLHLLGTRGEEGEVDSLTIPGRAAWIRLTGPDRRDQRVMLSV